MPKISTGDLLAVVDIALVPGDDQNVRWPVSASRFHRPDARRAPEYDESLAEWLNRQQNPVKASGAGNAAIMARTAGTAR